MQTVNWKKQIEYIHRENTCRLKVNWIMVKIESLEQRTGSVKKSFPHNVRPMQWEQPLTTQSHKNAKYTELSHGSVPSMFLQNYTTPLERKRYLKKIATYGCSESPWKKVWIKCKNWIKIHLRNCSSIQGYQIPSLSFARSNSLASGNQLTAVIANILVYSMEYESSVEHLMKSLNENNYFIVALFAEKRYRESQKVY